MSLIQSIFVPVCYCFCRKTQLLDTLILSVRWYQLVARFHINDIQSLVLRCKKDMQLQMCELQ